MICDICKNEIDKIDGYVNKNEKFYHIRCFNDFKINEILKLFEDEIKGVLK